MPVPVPVPELRAEAETEERVGPEKERKLPEKETEKHWASPNSEWLEWPRLRRLAAAAVKQKAESTPPSARCYRRSPEAVQPSILRAFVAPLYILFGAGVSPRRVYPAYSYSYPVAVAVGWRWR